MKILRTLKMKKADAKQKKVDGSIDNNNLTSLGKIADNLKLVYQLGKQHGSVSKDVLEDQEYRLRQVIASIK